MSRSLSRLLIISLASPLALTACGSSSSPRTVDAASDTPIIDAPRPDAPRPDIPLPDTRDLAPNIDTGAADTAIAANCTTPLSGTAPFGKALSGTAIFPATVGTRPSIESTFTAFVYFPNGRVPGGKVLLAMRSRVTQTQYFFGSEETLASDLSSPALYVRGHNVQIAGTLLPGADGLQAMVHADFSSPGTDVADPRTATMQLCPNGDVPDPTMKIATGLFSPLSGLGLFPSTPIAIDELNKLQITAPMGNVPFTVGKSPVETSAASGPNYVIVGKPAFPPGQKLTLDATKMKDLLGRNVTISLDPTRVLAPTATLGDLTFSTPATPGSLAATGCVASALGGADGGDVSDWLACTGGGTVAAGVLTVQGNQMRDRNVDAVVALRPEATATQLRVRMAVGDSVDAGTSCLNGNTYAYGTAVVAVVGTTGETTELKRIACGGGMLDHVFTLPGGSALVLVIHVEASPAVPYLSPPMGPPAIRIDELAFQ